MEKITERGTSYFMPFGVCYQGNAIKEDEIDAGCYTHMGNEKFVHDFSVKT